MIFAISYLRSWFQPQKTKEMLTQAKGVKANFAASRLGIGIGAVIRGWAPADF